MRAPSVTAVSYILITLYALHNPLGVFPLSPHRTRENVRLRRLVCFGLSFALWLGTCAAMCAAQEGGLARKQHPWGRFEPGAWKIVRVVTETFDDRGTIRSVTETQTTLKAVDEKGVTLQIEVLVGVGGKLFNAQPQIVRQGFHGEMLDQELQSKDLGTAEVAVGDDKIECRVLQLEVSGATGKKTTKVYYNDKVEPYVLRREVVKTDPAGGETTSKTTMEVVAVNVPCRVMGELHNCANLKIVQEHAKGTTTTLAFTTPDVPGGIVCHKLSELNEEGRLVRRSTMEVLDFDDKPDTRRRGLFWRRKHGIPRRPHRWRSD